MHASIFSGRISLAIPDGVKACCGKSLFCIATRLHQDSMLSLLVGWTRTPSVISNVVHGISLEMHTNT